MPMPKIRSRRRVAAALAAAVSLLALPGCAGAGRPLGTGADGTTTITFATVNNPQMKDLQDLAGQFEKAHPKIHVNVIPMEENDLRDAETKDVATQSGQYDVVTISNYEVPTWAGNGWLTDLGPRMRADKAYDYQDILPPVRRGLQHGKQVVAAPFYGESSFLMYRKDLFAKAGLTMPEHPTWKQVESYAKKVKSKDTAGICLRGKPGWGEMFAPLTTVVNTFGGHWYDMDWNAGVDGAGFRRGVSFYDKLLKEAGEHDPVSDGFTECLNEFSNGRAAMWYDATSAAGTLEDPKSSKVAGKVGYVHAPVDRTKESGWLYSWNFAVPKTSKHADAAWQFIRWATGKQYEQLVGSKLGWSRVPPGTRTSLYGNPDYRKASKAFADITRSVMTSVNPKQPGTQPQPYTGIQFVTIPEFQELGNRTSQDLADVIAGRKKLDPVLKAGQQRAQDAARFERRAKEK